MTRIVLERFVYHEDATIGRVSWVGGWCYSLEDPWNGNQVGISCIPEGWYLLRRGNFRGLYPNFELVAVVGRTAIEIHKGNTDADTEGCVLLGSSLILQSDAQIMLADSGKAFDRFMAAMAGKNEAVLAITHRTFPGPVIPV